MEAACFSLVFLFYFLYLELAGDDRFYYDAANYWELRTHFRDSGGFSLLAFDAPTRGYSLPFINFIIDSVGARLRLGDVTTARVFGSLVAATLGVVVVPRLAGLLFGKAHVGVARVLALNGLLFLYWRDHLGFPLTDFPALLAVCAGLIGLLRATPTGYVVAGCGFMLAANMRPAYMPAALAAIVLAAAMPLHGQPLRRRAQAASLVITGALIIALPQAFINHRHQSTWSPLGPGSREISLLQLTQGMHNQKYETYVGPVDGYPGPEVFYLDPATAHVLEAEGLTEISSYRQYAEIAVRHPAEMAAGWTRHVFNGLDVRYSTPYVHDLEDSSVLLSLLLYTLLFVALARLLIPSARRALGRTHWVGVAVLVSPCLSAIPGAVEPRFFLPLALLAYMLVCFGPETRATLFAGSRFRRLALGVTYAAFLVGCLTLSSATLSQLEHPGPTLDSSSLCCGAGD